MTIKAWDIIESRLIIDNPWYRLRKDVVKLPDGTQIDDYFISERPDISAVFALTKNEEIIFVRQYKHGVRQITLEVPAGTFRDEAPEDAAHRELQEETGYTSKKIIKLGTAYEDTTRNTNTLHMYIALECQKSGEQMLDSSEQSAGLDVILLPLSTALNLIENDEIRSMSSLLTILRAVNWLKTYK